MSCCSLLGLTLMATSDIARSSRTPSMKTSYRNGLNVLGIDLRKKRVKIERWTLCRWRIGLTIKPDDPTSSLLFFAILPKDAAEPLAPIHERNPILLSESSMAEWLDPDNLEDAEHTTADLLMELSDESDRVCSRSWILASRCGSRQCSKQLFKSDCSISLTIHLIQESFN